MTRKVHLFSRVLLVTQDQDPVGPRQPQTMYSTGCDFRPYGPNVRCMSSVRLGRSSRVLRTIGTKFPLYSAKMGYVDSA